MKIQQEISIEEVDNLKVLVLELIQVNDESRVFLIYHRIEKLFTKTDAYGKDIISNRFLLPITLSIEKNFAKKKRFIELLPLELKHEYCKQINHSSL